MSEKRKIFISHSSKDFEFADRLRRGLEENGLTCWIAPRDIPYGNVWCDEIVSAIENSELMIFIYSEDSNASVQVLREITLADQKGIKVMALKLSDEEYNAALNYYLCIYQWITMKRDAGEAELHQFVQGLQNWFDGDESLIAKAEGTPILDGEKDFQGGVNLDDALDARFKEMFGNLHTGVEEENTKSPLRQKCLDRIARRFVERMAPAKRESECEESDEQAVNDGAGEEETEKESTGKYFRLSEKDGDTKVFRVCKKISESDYSVEYVPVLLEKAVTHEKDDIIATYFVEDFEDENGFPLVIVSVLRDSPVILVNMGWLSVSYDVVKISQKPMTLERKTTVDEKEERKIRCLANYQSRNVSMDLKTLEILEYKKFFDRKRKQWGYYYEIVNKRQYFAFQLNSHGGEIKTANQFDIGYGYYKGSYGLPKNILNAVEWFDKSGTKEAYKYLSEIFRTDPYLADEEDAEYYRKLSEE